MIHEENHEWELTPEKLAQLLASDVPVRLIDVREINEYDICRLDGAELIPMAGLPGALPSINKEEHLVFY